MGFRVKGYVTRAREMGAPTLTVQLLFYCFRFDFDERNLTAVIPFSIPLRDPSPSSFGEQTPFQSFRCRDCASSLRSILTRTSNSQTEFSWV